MTTFGTQNKIGLVSSLQRRCCINPTSLLVCIDLYVCSSSYSSSKDDIWSCVLRFLCCAHLQGGVYKNGPGSAYDSSMWNIGNVLLRDLCGWMLVSVWCCGQCGILKWKVDLLRRWVLYRSYQVFVNKSCNTACILNSWIHRQWP